MKRPFMLLLLTTVIMGLTAGIFFCWSISVTKGLAPLPDKEYLMAFQSLNREILNPLFFICFLGPVILLPASAWQQYAHPVPLRCWLLLAAAAVYIVGVIIVTFAGNVPLNDTIDAFNISAATTTQIADCRMNFEARWNGLNTIRTLACIISFVLTVLACMDRYPIREVKMG